MNRPTDHRPPDAVRPRNVWTFADLPRGPAPAPLAGPYLTPEGVTILYGPGGAGKGFVALHLAQELIRLHNMRVVILDFENHPYEWGRRGKAMGYTAADESMSRYWTPNGGDYWASEPGPLVKVAKRIRELLDVERVDYVIIDSFMAATSGAEGMGGQADAVDLFDGLKVLNRPTLVIAHVASAGPKWPGKPFGSVHVRNQARSLWAADRPGSRRVGDDTDDRSIALELHNTKESGRAESPPQFLTFMFDADGKIGVDTHAPAARTNETDDLADIKVRILAVLEEAAPDGLTTSAIRRLKLAADYRILAALAELVTGKAVEVGDGPRGAKLYRLPASAPPDRCAPVRSPIGETAAQVARTGRARGADPCGAQVAHRSRTGRTGQNSPDSSTAFTASDFSEKIVVDGVDDETGSESESQPPAIFAVVSPDPHKRSAA
jgi:hypothetical protein